MTFSSFEICPLDFLTAFTVSQRPPRSVCAFEDIFGICFLSMYYIHQTIGKYPFLIAFDIIVPTYSTFTPASPNFSDTPSLSEIA